VERPLKLELGPINVFITPAIFHFYGREFLAAEERYSPPGKYSPVPYYLVCHSIELFLKGHLSLRGLRSDELKAIFGHNLEKCLDEAEACDLSEFAVVHGVDRVEIAKANEYYLKRGSSIPPGWRRSSPPTPAFPTWTPSGPSRLA
jgi:hypothetical protein